MRTDPKGFIYGDESPRVSRINVAIRAPELAALERSENRSLQALAKRIRESLEHQDQFWREKKARDLQLIEISRKRRAEIDADPVLKAEQEERRKKFAGLFR